MSFGLYLFWKRDDAFLEDNKLTQVDTARFDQLVQCQRTAEDIHFVASRDIGIEEKVLHDCKLACEKREMREERREEKRRYDKKRREETFLNRNAKNISIGQIRKVPLCPFDHFGVVAPNDRGRILCRKLKLCEIGEMD